MERYIMIVDGSMNGVDEEPVICVGNTVDELARVFEKKSQFYFLENILPNAATYSPCDVAIVFDMENEGKPLMIEKVLQLKEFG